LKWAFAFPGASSASAQPVVWGGRLYGGSYEGELYSLDAKTGCIYWSLQTEAAVRGAVSIARAKDGTLTVYFGDMAANVYAASAATGKILWKVKVDDYPLACITASPKLHDGRLYVPVSSREESQVGNPRYECCRFRGSVVALDAAAGKQLWKTYVISGEPRPTQKNRAGTQLYGPSGGAIWNSPTIDVKRNAVYVGTGNDYSTPAVTTSDSIVAFDMNSGKIRWVRQMTQSDIWNSSCRPDGDPSTCPDADAPDYDFAASPVLVELKGGRRLLIAGQKSGLVYAFDPDHDGKTVWTQRAGKGGTSGGVMFGPAADSEYVYVAVSDAKKTNGKPDPSGVGGMVAINLATGEKVWSTPNPPCEEEGPCSPSQAAAVSAIPGVVFAGSNDGHMRAYSAKDGKIIWDYDTVQEYKTVNGVKAKGGSINDGGAAIVGGLLFTNSGYSHHSGVIPGNALLAFSAE
jgi:polyvinyl alcohol dehydrogenase (cytochrome)